MNALTKARKKINTAPAKMKPVQQNEPINTIQPGKLKEVKLKDIAPPMNYRKVFNPVTLQELAEDISRHTLISPLTVRVMDSGRYQLVVGERRYRAAGMIGLSVVPVLVMTLTDEEVTELQLAENMQRENPHPLDEAHAVNLLKAAGKSIEEIALRLGKSKAFVYSRIKISQLIEPIQEIFIADKCSMADAMEISSLAAESQQEYFDSYCSNWQSEGFRMYNVSNMVTRLKYDLKNAPFNTKDKKLIPTAAACTNCPFNSATLKSLFPELAKEAKCTNATCFRSKCQAHTTARYLKALESQQPQALILTWIITSTAQVVLDSLPELVDLPSYHYSSVDIIREPQAPDREDFDYEEEFDQQGFDQATQEYLAEMDAYKLAITAENILSGLVVESDDPYIVYFNPVKQQQSNNGLPTVTAKEVQEAIKEGTITEEMLQAEIQRINTKEIRYKALDLEKNQLNIHTQFCKSLEQPENITEISNADIAALQLIIYQSLDFHSRNYVDKIIFEGHNIDGCFEQANRQRYEIIANLSPQQLSLLIRLSIAGKYESKIAGTSDAACLYDVARDAGIDIFSIEAEQKAKAEVRQSRQQERIAELEKRIAALPKDEAA